MEAREAPVLVLPSPKHVFIISSAGKPIYCFGKDASEAGIVPLMGLIQGLLSFIRRAPDEEGHTELSCVERGDQLVVFAKQEEVTLVAVSTIGESEAYLRLQLHFLYAQLLFFLTESGVQNRLRAVPSFNLENLLCGTQATMDNIVLMSGRDARLLSGGVTTLWIDPDIRKRLTKVLTGAQKKSPNMLCAVWCYGEEVVCLSQVKPAEHQLHTQDLLLLINFVSQSVAKESHFSPVCLPRFRSAGYLHMYTAFLDEGEGRPLPSSPGKPSSTGKAVSCLMLVSTDNSAQQLREFVSARDEVEAGFARVLGGKRGLYLSPTAIGERRRVLNHFCEVSGVLHFIYKVPGQRGASPPLSQCVSPPFTFPYSSSSTCEGAPAASPQQQRAWNLYSRGVVMLRRGTAEQSGGIPREVERGRGQESPPHLPGTLFDEAPSHNLAVERSQYELLISIAAKGFEMHALFPSTTETSHAHAVAGKLIRTIQRDGAWLFLE